MWAVQLIGGIFHVDITFTHWFRFARFLFCVFWSFHRSRIWSGDKGSEDMMVEHVPKNCLFY
jgi:hypothetical protein